MGRKYHSTYVKPKDFNFSPKGLRIKFSNWSSWLSFNVIAIEADLKHNQLYTYTYALTQGLPKSLRSNLQIGSFINLIKLSSNNSTGDAIDPDKLRNNIRLLISPDKTERLIVTRKLRKMLFQKDETGRTVLKYIIQGLETEEDYNNFILFAIRDRKRCRLLFEYVPDILKEEQSNSLLTDLSKDQLNYLKRAFVNALVSDDQQMQKWLSQNGRKEIEYNQSIISNILATANNIEETIEKLHFFVRNTSRTQALINSRLLNKADAASENLKANTYEDEYTNTKKAIENIKATLFPESKLSPSVLSKLANDKRWRDLYVEIVGNDKLKQLKEQLKSESIISFSRFKNWLRGWWRIITKAITRSSAKEHIEDNSVIIESTYYDKSAIQNSDIRSFGQGPAVVDSKVEPTDGDNKPVADTLTQSSNRKSQHEKSEPEVIIDNKIVPVSPVIIPTTQHSTLESQHDENQSAAIIDGTIAPISPVILTTQSLNKESQHEKIKSEDNFAGIEKGDFYDENNPGFPDDTLTSDDYKLSEEFKNQHKIPEVDPSSVQKSPPTPEPIKISLSSGVTPGTLTPPTPDNLTPPTPDSLKSPPTPEDLELSPVFLNTSKVSEILSRNENTSLPTSEIADGLIPSPASIIASPAPIIDSPIDNNMHEKPDSLNNSFSNLEIINNSLTIESTPGAVITYKPLSDRSNTTYSSIIEKQSANRNSQTSYYLEKENFSSAVSFPKPPIQSNKESNLNINHENEYKKERESVISSFSMLGSPKNQPKHKHPNTTPTTPMKSQNTPTNTSAKKKKLKKREQEEGVIIHQHSKSLTP